jgi:hypothetical protein
MCCGCRRKAVEEPPPAPEVVQPVMTKSQILTVLIDKYIDVVLTIKKHRLNESRTMSKLTYIKTLEKKIESIEPITRYQKRVFQDYLDYKNKIDLMIFPEGLPWLKRKKQSETPPFIIEVDRSMLENTKKIAAVEEERNYKIIDDNSGIVVDREV